MAWVGKEISVGGIATRYIEAGEAGKPAMVLIHAGAFSKDGFFNNAWCWEFNLEKLGEDFHVLAVETLGQGMTASPQDAGPPSFDRIVEHVMGFIDTLGITSVHLVGHDHGALAATRLAFERPELVATCCVVNGISLTPPGDAIENPLLADPPHAEGSPDAQGWFLERVSVSPDHIANGRFLTESEALAKGASGPRGENLDAAVEKSMAGLKTDNFVRFREHGFPVPILILWGDADPLASREQARQWGLERLYSPAAWALSLFDHIAPKQPITQMKLISGTGYMPFREAPEVFNNAVAAFAAAAETIARRSA